MKAIVIAIAAAAVFAPALQAVAQLAPKSSLSLDAKVAASGSSARTTSNYYYYRARKYESSVLLEYKIRNLSQNPTKCVVEWYFIGKPMSGSKRFIYDKGSTEVALEGGQWREDAVESESLEGTRERGYYYRYETGSKADGWIIRLRENDKIVRVKASSHTYEQAGWNEPELQRLIKAGEKEDKT